MTYDVSTSQTRSCRLALLISELPRQLLVERSAFQAVASVAAPFAIIHTTVDATKHVLKHFKAKGALGR